jgi:hypothetical protein
MQLSLMVKCFSKHEAYTLNESAPTSWHSATEGKFDFAQYLNPTEPYFHFPATYEIPFLASDHITPLYV